MQRPDTGIRVVTLSDQARRLARAMNPLVASPSAPRETVAALDALGPSLMPRTSRLQGLAMGLCVLGARATSGVAEMLTRTVAPADAPLPRQLVHGRHSAAPERRWRLFRSAMASSCGWHHCGPPAGYFETALPVVRSMMWAACCNSATRASAASGR
jgi:hypothetical protein